MKKKILRKNSKNTWLVQYVAIIVSEWIFIQLLVMSKSARMMYRVFLDDTSSSYRKC